MVRHSELTPQNAGSPQQAQALGSFRGAVWMTNQIPDAPFRYGRGSFSARGTLIMGKNIYVGNLPYDSTGDDLVELFQAYGTVNSGQVIIDKFSGRSRGFGFVEMANDDETQAAIEALNGAPFGGRPLTVNEARPREERGGGNRGGGFGGGRGGYGGGSGGSYGETGYQS